MNLASRFERSWVYAIIMMRHKLPFLYDIANIMNSIYARLAFRTTKKLITRVKWNGVLSNDRIVILNSLRAANLAELISSEPEELHPTFRPHTISERIFTRLLRAPYYTAVGYIRDEKLIGYAFLYLYFPRKAFAGYFVLHPYRGQGIGRSLFNVLQDIARSIRFPLYTYVHKDNPASLRISRHFTVEREMPNGYILLKHSTEPL